MPLSHLPRRILGAVVALCLAAPLLGAGTVPVLTQGEAWSEPRVTTIQAQREAEETQAATDPETEAAEQIAEEEGAEESHSEGGAEPVEPEDQAAVPQEEDQGDPTGQEATDQEVDQQARADDSNSTDQTTQEQSPDNETLETPDTNTDAASATAENWRDLLAVVEAACDDAGTVSLTSDITAPPGENLNLAGCEITLDLNGYALEIEVLGNLAAVHVPSSASLTINDSSNGAGSLIAASSDEVGIGGENGDGGTVTINGGEVTATSTGFGAGIGGGNNGAGGTVTINGGVVRATGSNGAGIGGGLTGAGGTVTINGGEVTATSSADGAGIGGGLNGAGGTVTINGGEVTATSTGYGAGIGGGRDGAGGTVTIEGGTVTATSNGAGIGAGPGNGDPGSVTVRALRVEGSANNGGGPDHLAAPVTWEESEQDPDLYAFARTDLNEDGGVVFELDFGYMVTIEPHNDQETTDHFAALGTTPEVPAGPQRPGYAFIGWRVGSPEGPEWEPEPLSGPLTIHATWRWENTDEDGALRAGDWDELTTAVAPACTEGTIRLTGDITAPAGENLDLAGCEITLDLDSYALEIQVSGNLAAVHVPSSASLTINDSSNGAGSLTATSNRGAGIGGGRDGAGGTVTINGGEVTATSSADGAGIGGGLNGAGGTVTITGGAITATSTDYGAGIGGGGGSGLDGDGGDGGTVTIEGGTVTATSRRGAGIGGGGSSGLNSDGGDSGTVTIEGGTVTATSNSGAGIGGGGSSGLNSDGGDGGTVTINGGEVTATSNNHGAGIGGGSSYTDGGGGGGTVTITGGVVRATGSNGAGIGGGDYGSGGEVTINGGEVTATSSAGAGIGGGRDGAGGTVTINGGEVTATSTGNGAGIGGGGFLTGGGGGGGIVTITGGVVRANGGQGAAGVGAGLEGSDRGSVMVGALGVEGSANNGGGPGSLAAPVTWEESEQDPDLYAFARTDLNEDGGGVFELDFGYMVTMVDLALELDDEDRQVDQFIAFGDAGTVPEQPQVLDGYTPTGWRDAAPAGEVVTDSVSIDNGPVRLYSTAAAAMLSTETITAGQVATVTVNALDQDSELVDVTEDAQITLAGEETGPNLSPSTSGNHDIDIEYLGATFSFELLVDPAGAGALEVTGPNTVTETQTVVYTLEVFDDYGNTHGTPTMEPEDVSSSVAGDQISITENNEVEVTYAFTPEALTDRVLTFTYTGENDDAITETVHVEVASVVEGLILEVPDQAGHGEAVQVMVTALDEDDQSLGEVTPYVEFSSSVEDDRVDIDTGTLSFIGAGPRVITATYRGVDTTGEVEVQQAVTEVNLTAEQDTVTAGQDMVLEVTVDSPAPGNPVPTGEVEVWDQEAGIDEEIPLAVGTLSDGGVTIAVADLTDAGEYSLVVVYTGTSDFTSSTSDPVEVTIEPAAPDSITVEGPTQVTETDTRTYLTIGYDQFGNRIGFLTGDTVIASNVPTDEITGNQVEYAFTPEALTDRVLTFTYTGEDDQQITTTVEVSVHSVVEGIELSIDPARAVVGASVEVSVEAFNTEGEPLGEVTEYTTVTFEGDPVEGGEFTLPSAGTHQLEASYRGVTDDQSVSGEIPVLEALEVIGDEELTETQTGTYEISGTDQFGDPISMDFQHLEVTSSENTDTITVDEQTSQVQVEYAFTPEALTDRVLTFTYTGENDDAITETVHVEVASVVEGLILEVPDQAGHGEAVQVMVTALDEDDQSLGEVTPYVEFSSSVEDDRVDIDTGTLSFIGAGPRVITATYRGVDTTGEVEVQQAVTEVNLTAEQDTVTAGQDMVLEVTVDSPAPGNPVPTGEVEVWDQEAGIDEEIPLAVGTLSDGGVTIAVADLTDAGEYSLVVIYTGTSDFTSSTSDPVEVTIEPAAPDSITVEGPTQVTETDTRTYLTIGYDQFGNRIGFLTGDTVIASNVPTDEITGNQVEYAFTPEALTDRVLTFTYTGEDDQQITTTAEVSVHSVVEGIDIDLPAEVADGETVPVTVTALDSDGQALGVVTSQSWISSDADEDEITNGQLSFTGIGQRIVSASYRDQRATTSVEVHPAGAGTLEVTGPSTVTETQTVVYTLEVFDDYGNTHGAPTMEPEDVSSSVAGDQISITEDGEVEVTFAFTPEALIDRELRFTHHTDDQLLVVTIQVEITSAVDTLTVEAPATAEVEDTIAVGVRALDSEGVSLGEVTSYTVLSSSVEDDVIEGNEIILATAGERTLTAAYRDLTGTIDIEVTAAVDEPITPEIIGIGSSEIFIGDTQSATVTGYAPGTEVSATMYSDPYFIGTQAADKTGTVIFTWEIPENTEPGDHIVVTSAPGYHDASIPFTVLTPQPQPTPTEEPTQEPTPTEEPSPTQEPTGEPSPTVEPTATPSPTETPTSEDEEDNDEEEDLAATGSSWTHLLPLGTLLLVLGALVITLTNRRESRPK
ncbi:Ig-like domain repeat protein [Nesterenkonia ebinurensis]|uniref:Ig-like domain repeat protein n=1 Tax=Nesterenkonia ebinurensis TaxID=2608252 RepID=UPI00168B85E4|nr:Ig-like domain repeat protein [Nesterenkonia ebinurensis]